MAKPCGCGGAGVTVRCRNGIRCSGVGSVVSPLVIEWEVPLDSVACDAVMTCVGSNIGGGLTYNAVTGTISAKISTDSGNQIKLGTDGGLWAPGGGGATGGGATVQGLVNRTSPFAGGSYGAGYAIIPEGGELMCYRYGLDMELPLMHVPVRRTADYFLIAQHYRDFGNYNWRFNGAVTNAVDINQTDRIWYTPAGDPFAIDGNWRNPGYTPQSGYYGFGAVDRLGTTLLSDVFSLVQRRTVLYLEVKDIGASIGESGAPYDTFSRLQVMIRMFGAQESVIVGAEYPTEANAADRQSILNGLQQLNSQDGIAIGLHLTSTAMIDSVTPDGLWNLGFRWVFISYGIADVTPAKVKAFKDRGFNVMLFTGHRQWHWNLTKDTTKWGPGGLKGILCSDPVYCAGETTNYRYRKEGASWNWHNADYGRHAYVGSIPWMRDRFRGYINNGQAGFLSLDGDVLLPNDTDPNFRPSGYLILQGEQCPVPTYDPVTRTSNNYEIHVGFLWTGMSVDRSRWMSVFFANPEDRSLTEWEWATEYTRGYQFQLTQNGLFTFGRWDGAYPPVNPPVGGNAWASGWGNLSPNIEYRVQVQVRPGSIRVGRADGGAMREFTGPFATQWRGPYFYLGRHFFNTPDSSTVRWVWSLARKLP